MIKRTLARMFILTFSVLIIATLSSAIAASNTVDDSGAGYATRLITVNDLKPPECAALDLTTLIVGSGNMTGTNDNDLMLGSSGADDMDGGRGDDCVVGGAGNDILKGSNNKDVLLGGDGDDVLRGGNQTDVCYGGPGTDTTDGTCETMYSIP